MGNNWIFSVIGMGKLGASMAAAMTDRGFEVIGVDVNSRTVELVNAGHAPVQETKLEETIAANHDRLRATMSHSEAILNSDVSFVIVPTPSDERGAFSIQYAKWAFKEIGRALAEKSGYHLVVMTSTVLPGATRNGLLPTLEEESGKKCGPDFGLCYSPEFIALGSIIDDYLNPDFTLVGQFDERSGSLLEQCYARIMLNDPPCKRMSLENAELAKIALNTYVTTKITFANILADLCERIPGGDVDAITDALGTDCRIGHRYLIGSIGYGGPCFPRDNVALNFIARAIGAKSELGEVTDRINRALPENIIKRLKPYFKRGTTVAILGLAYKPFSHIVEESHGIYLARALNKSGMRVIAYDPLAAEMARVELHDQTVVLDSIMGCLGQAEVVMITTPDPAFQQLKARDFIGDKHSVTVVDFWRILDSELTGKKNIKYIPIGRSRDDASNTACLVELWGEKSD